VVGFHGGELKVLLLKWRQSDRWSLPGGFVGRDESLDAAAERILRERTGLERIFLQQFHAFGRPDRGEAEILTFLSEIGVEVPAGHWIADRHVTIGYLALVDVAEVRPTPGMLSEESRWWDVRGLPPMALDHGEIVARALETLRAQASYLPLGLNLLPEKFTMPDLQRLHEAVLGRPLDRRNFQKKILDLGFVERLPERKTGGAHRAPFFYRFVPATKC
jgi:ADP-ribose pyrophosphatase YjhB (NUDIX family)